MNKRYIAPPDSKGTSEFIVRSHNAIPPIVCLCGSTKFRDEFTRANALETMKGNIVLSVGFFMHSTPTSESFPLLSEEEKAGLDNLHLRKIDLADEVIILNVIPTRGLIGEIDQEPSVGYIGRSTRREAWYARRQDKPLRFLNPLVVDGQILTDWELINRYVDSWFANWAAWKDAAKEAAKVV